MGGPGSLIGEAQCELTVLRRAEQVARRVEILEALGLKRRPGGQPDPDTMSGQTPRSTKEMANWEA